VTPASVCLAPEPDDRFRAPRDPIVLWSDIAGTIKAHWKQTMKIKGNAVRPGMVLEHNGGLWLAVRSQHTMPGKGGAFQQVELKNVRTGSKLNERFRATEDVERVRLDQREYQYLYADDHLLTFMNTETFEQIEIEKELVGDGNSYLQDGMVVTIESYEGQPIGLTLPETVVLEITETEAVVKGQTAAASYKPATLENGLRILVPPFIENGTSVVVNTVDGSYAKRADN